MNYIFYIMMLISCAFFPIHSMQLVNFFNAVKQGTFKDTSLRIPMNGSGAISLTPMEINRPLIYTRGLVGCTASALYAQDSEGRRHAILTHFSDGNKQHIIELKERIQLLTAQHQIKTVKFFVITPEEKKEYRDLGHLFHCQQMKYYLEQIVNENIQCSNIQTTQVKYDLAPFVRASIFTSYDTEIYSTLSNGKISFECKILNWKQDHTFKTEEKN
jgi:hypothetical protein